MMTGEAGFPLFFANFVVKKPRQPKNDWTAVLGLSTQVTQCVPD